jgi:2-iminobutanoate/2-iminopropanoate deaminase
MSTTTSTHPSLEVVSTKSVFSQVIFICPASNDGFSGAPAAIGPYSQAIKANGLLFVSGSLGFDPATMAIVEGGIEAQTEQALKNLRAILEDGGSSVGQVIKTTVRPRFLKNSQRHNNVALLHRYAAFLEVDG